MKKTKVFLEGTLSKINIVNIKNEIESIFNDYNIVDIEISNITDIDEYFLQLCYHLKLNVEKRDGKSISFCLDENTTLAAKIEKAGFLQLVETKAS